MIIPAAMVVMQVKLTEPLPQSCQPFVQWCMGKSQKVTGIKAEKG